MSYTEKPDTNTQGVGSPSKIAYLLDIETDKKQFPHLTNGTGIFRTKVTGKFIN